MIFHKVFKNVRAHLCPIPSLDLKKAEVTQETENGSAPSSLAPGRRKGRRRTQPNKHHPLGDPTPPRHLTVDFTDAPGALTLQEEILVFQKGAIFDSS